MKLHSWTNHLTRGSSPVDWCEDNYSFTPLIGKIEETYKNTHIKFTAKFLMIT